MLTSLTYTAVLFFGLLTVARLAFACVPTRWREKAHRRSWKRYEAAKAQHDARIEARLAKGEDRYFEELRSLKAYAPQPPQPPGLSNVNWLGLAYVAVSCFFAVELWLRPD